jgi:hypothetical protein
MPTRGFERGARAAIADHCHHGVELRGLRPAHSRYLCDWHALRTSLFAAVEAPQPRGGTGAINASRAHPNSSRLFLFLISRNYHHLVSSSADHIHGPPKLSCYYLILFPFRLCRTQDNAIRHFACCNQTPECNEQLDEFGHRDLRQVSIL